MLNYNRSHGEYSKIVVTNNHKYSVILNMESLLNRLQLWHKSFCIKYIQPQWDAVHVMPTHILNTICCHDCWYVYGIAIKWPGLKILESTRSE